MQTPVCMNVNGHPPAQEDRLRRADAGADPRLPAVIGRARGPVVRYPTGMHRSSSLAVLAFLTLPLAAVAKPPVASSLSLTQFGDCFLLESKAPSLTPEARAKVAQECKACFAAENMVKSGQKPQLEIVIKDANTAQAKCTMKAVAVLPTKVQMAGNDAGFRCAALFEKYSSECQTCVAGGGAFLEWPDGKGECATKPKGPAISKPAECAFAGKAGKDCIECLFQKKKWKVNSNSCE